MKITRWEIYGIVLLIVAAIVFHAYKADTGKTQARVDQVQQDLKPVHEEAAKEKASAAVAESSNQVALTAALAVISKQQQAPVDYDKLTAMIIAKLGPGYKVDYQKADPKLPDAPSSVTITGPDAPEKIRNGILDCDKSDAEFNSCKLSVANITAQLAAEVKDHKADKDELDRTKKAVDGSFWTKLGRGATHSVCGAAGTAAGIESAKKSGDKAGVFFGVGSFVGCEVFTHLKKK